MADTSSGAGTSRNLLERIGARIPGFRGYLDRELRREIDQMLRAELATRLDQARALIAARVRTLSLAAAPEVARLDAIAKQLDGAANALRHAGSGYGGFFDAVKVGERELEALYRYDLDLVENVDAVVAIARTLSGGETIDALGRSVTGVRRRIDDRAAQVKSLLSA